MLCKVGYMEICTGSWIGMLMPRIIDGNILLCFGQPGEQSRGGFADCSGDYMQATRMKFNTKEDAIAFAEKQGWLVLDKRVLISGWEYYIQEPHNSRFKPKAYATNFNYCTPTL